MTKKIYFDYDAMNQNSLVANARILRLERGEGILWLDQTIFHPQGGGQKNDLGVIRTMENSMLVTMVEHGEGGEVKHFGEIPSSFEVGQEVTLLVDPIKREEYAAYHTAGHLLAALVEQSYPALLPLKGHHWPGEAKVEFEIGQVSLPEKEALQHELNHALQSAIQDDLPVVIGYEDGKRHIRIGTWSPVPCGGTHVASLSDLQGMMLKQIKKKSGRLLISYTR